MREGKSHTVACKTHKRYLIVVSYIIFYIWKSLKNRLTVTLTQLNPRLFSLLLSRECSQDQTLCHHLVGKCLRHCRGNVWLLTGNPVRRQPNSTYRLGQPRKIFIIAKGHLQNESNIFGDNTLFKTKIDI